MSAPVTAPSLPSLLPPLSLDKHQDGLLEPPPPLRQVLSMLLRDACAAVGCAAMFLLEIAPPHDPLTVLPCSPALSAASSSSNDTGSPLLVPAQPATPPSLRLVAAEFAESTQPGSLVSVSPKWTPSRVLRFIGDYAMRAQPSREFGARLAAWVDPKSSDTDTEGAPDQVRVWPVYLFDRLFGALLLRGHSHIPSAHSDGYDMATRVTQALEGWHFRHYFSSGFDALCVLDPAGCVVSAGPAVRTVMGWSPHELIDRPLIRWMQADGDGAAFVRALQVALETGFAVTRSHVSQPGGRAPRLVSWSLSAAKLERGAVSRVLCVGRDVSAQAAMMEALLVHKGRAEEAATLKTQCLASLSHEIRTPISGVRGMAILLQQTNLTPEQDEYVSNILVAGNHLLSIVNAVLDVSKLEHGAVELEAQTVDIFKLVEDALDLAVSGRPSAALLDIYYFIEDDVPGFIISDETRLKQIITNLVGNSVKFTKSGFISVYIRSLSVSERIHTIECSVSDSGCGIPESKMPLLFKPFSQCHSNYGGTGLGLSISHKLVSLMGGKMSASSHEGSGSVFTFTIRASAADASPLLSAQPSPAEYCPGLRSSRSCTPRPMLPPSRALVIDSHSKHGELAAAMLRRWGLHVTHVCSVEEAERALAAVTTSPTGGDGDRTATGFDIAIIDCDTEVPNRITHSQSSSSLSRAGVTADGATATPVHITRSLSLSAARDSLASAASAIPEQNLPPNAAGAVSFACLRCPVFKKSAETRPPSLPGSKTRSLSFSAHPVVPVEDEARTGPARVLSPVSPAGRSCQARPPITGSPQARSLRNVASERARRLLSALYLQHHCPAILFGPKATQPPEIAADGVTQLPAGGFERNVWLNEVRAVSATTDLPAHTLRKPVKWSALLKLLNRSIGSPPRNAEYLTRTPTPAPRVQLASCFALQFPLRILLADDERINRRVLATGLAKLGYAHVVVAQDGQMAVEQERLHRPDIVFLDMQMPHKSGLEAAAEIRHRHEAAGTQCPVLIALTASDSRHERELCLGAGGLDDYLTKPLDFPLLMARLRYWAQQRGKILDALPASAASAACAMSVCSSRTALCHESSTHA